ncbi:phosphate transporter [Podochytrium sp. JEL0797]|nr:phosphate transporter [Podochytrium sp. JEL0797]KAJ3075245.1 phosphate transporter [Podochytrium sp. JEL0797]
MLSLFGPRKYDFWREEARAADSAYKPGQRDISPFISPFRHIITSETLAHLDDQQLGWFHLKMVMIAGAGFFSDAYDLFVISQALPMIYQVYWGPEYIKGDFPSVFDYPNGTARAMTPQNTKVDFINNYPNGAHMDSFVKASTNWGNLIGQIGFGIIGDAHGRGSIYGMELLIIIICTTGSVLSSSMVRGANIIQLICFWRFFLGIGIGGDYPMSAVITSEYANVRNRGMMLAAVFAMQGIGIFMGSIVYIATLSGLQSQIQADYTYLDYVWRIAIGLGIVPAIITVYFRVTLPETPRYTADALKKAERAARDLEMDRNAEEMGYVVPVRKAKVSKMAAFKAHFSQWKNMKILIGTAYCWFALDVAWYGMALNQSTVLALINFNGPKQVSVNVTTDGVTALTKVDPPLDIQSVFYDVAVGNIIIACAGTVPGYWFTVALIEKMGRKPIQIMGFIIIAICLAILAADWNSISTNQIGFMAVYTIAQFFFQFGPNTTCFVIPGEVFPTRFKATCHGMSAACGKAGAILGIQAVGPYFTSNTVSVLATFSAIMFSGAFATLLLPETCGKTLEELSGDVDSDDESDDECLEMGSVRSRKEHVA